VWLSGLAALIIMFALVAAVGKNDPNTKTVVISVQGEATESMTLAAAPPTATLSSQTAPSPSATTATTRVPSKAPAPVVTTHSPTTAPTTASVAPTSAAPTSTAQTAPAPPPTSQAPDTCGGPANPDGYTLCPGGSLIYSPASDVCDYFDCIANFQNGRGYMVECNDGTYSKSGGRRGDCSDHGGEQQAVYSS
jgi:cytoskeletal protein RodZ